MEDIDFRKYYNIEIFEKHEHDYIKYKRDYREKNMKADLVLLKHEEKEFHLILKVTKDRFAGNQGRYIQLEYPQLAKILLSK